MVLTTSCSNLTITTTEAVTTTHIITTTLLTTPIVTITRTSSVSNTTISPERLIVDINLEAAISDEFYMYDRPLFISDLETLTSLIAPGEFISELTGLEYCIRLENLEIQNNNVRDISPLRQLQNLRILILNDNNISDILPLVENIGLGNGDEVHLKNNKLNLAEASEDMLNIRTLQNRGVIVYY
jgi:Leucine-rich repeat (LRR) protein